MNRLNIWFNPKRFLIVALFFSVFYNYSQVKTTENYPLRIGFISGSGTQESFLFESANYFYETKFYKAQITYCFFKKRKIGLSLNIEPSFYTSQYYTTIDRTYEFEHHQTRTIHEFALNIGLKANLSLFREVLSSYFLGSIGPTFSNTETERLNSGMSFSDIIALGCNIHILPMALIDLRLSFRHVSNAGLNYPNKGYNSLNFEVGFSFPITKK